MTSMTGLTSVIEVITVTEVTWAPAEFAPLATASAGTVRKKLVPGALVWLSRKCATGTGRLSFAAHSLPRPQRLLRLLRPPQGGRRRRMPGDGEDVGDAEDAEDCRRR